MSSTEDEDKRAKTGTDKIQSLMGSGTGKGEEATGGIALEVSMVLFLEAEAVMLRGYAKRNAEATHCPKGHPYTEENVRIGDKGERRCRICRNTESREWMRGYRERMRPTI